MHMIQQSPSSSGCSSSCEPGTGPASSALDNPEMGKDRGTQSIKSVCFFFFPAGDLLLFYEFTQAVKPV